MYGVISKKKETSNGKFLFGISIEIKLPLILFRIWELEAGDLAELWACGAEYRFNIVFYSNRKID